MSGDSSEPKIFPPTEKKLNDLKKKGQIPKTEMAAGIFQLFAFCSIFIIFFYFLFENFDLLLTSILSIDSQPGFRVSLSNAIIAVIILMLIKVCLFFLNWITVGKKVLSTEQLTLKLDKLNPIQGFKNNYGFSAVIRSFRTIISLIFLFVIIRYNMTIFSEKLNQLFQSNNKSFFIYLFIMYLLYVTILFLIFAITVGIIDFMFEKFQFIKKNRMTLTEMKKESKDTEGSPEIKSKRKQKMRELAEEPSVFKGRKPSFALANPTHILIPICYDPSIDIAPYVMRMSFDILALDERTKLQKEDVVIIEDKKLTQEIYLKMKKGEQYIDPAFFKHVAIILAVLKRKRNLTKIK